MPSIFDLVTSKDIASYWNTKGDTETEGLLGDELFDTNKKLGLNMSFIKGSKGLPAVLKPSAYDAVALKRDRIGFEKITSEMPFFKESMMIDEELRQQLNMVIETGNANYIDSVVTRIFDDDMQLLRGARAQRERMRMSLITTGGISIAANGQDYEYDFGMNPAHKVTVKVAWSDPNAPIIEDIRAWQDMIEEEEGERPSRAVCSSKTFNYFVNNNHIKNAIWGTNSTAPVSREKVRNYISTELGLSIAVYSKKYLDETKTKRAFVPDDLFVLLPSGYVGTGWFGTTPEESDLMASNVANVTIVDTGVAITTTQKVDPVNVDTKVSMIYLPSFEGIDQIVIADLIPG